MKTLFASLVVLIIACSPAISQNCTPDPAVVSAGIEGIFPNSTVSPNLPDGTVGVPYTTTITFVIPADTTVDLSAVIGFPYPPVTVIVNYFEAVAPVLLPAGLAAVCEPSSCQTLGGSNGCMAFEGTPTASGTTPISITGFMSVTVPPGVPVIGGMSQMIPLTNAPYSLTIVTGSVSIEEQSSNAVVFPNPFCSELIISFESIENQSSSVSVFNSAGQIVETKTIVTNQGISSVVFSTQQWNSGVYYYSVSENGHLLTSGSITKE